MSTSLMVKRVKNNSKENRYKKIKIYEIEFSDLSFIKNLSEDCFGIIKQFCGKFYIVKHKRRHRKYLQSIKFFCENNLLYDGIEKLFNDDPYSINCLIAIQYGSVDILIYMDEIYPITDYTFVFNNACKYGQVNILKWMENKITTEMLISYKKNGFFIACGKGYLDILSWMRTKYVYKYNDLQACYEHAVKCHRLDVVIWLNKEIPDKMYKILEDNSGIQWACENGNLDVIKWVNNTYPNIVCNAIKQNESNEILYACKYGHFNILEWMKGTYPELIAKHKSCFLNFLEDFKDSYLFNYYDSNYYKNSRDSDRDCDSDSDSDSDYEYDRMGYNSYLDDYDCNNMLYKKGNLFKTYIWTEYEILQTPSHNGLYVACAKNQSNVLTWMKNKYPIITIQGFKYNKCEVFYMVLWNNNSSIFKWLKCELPDLVRELIMQKN